MNKPRILLAEDESILRMDLREMLKESGYVVAGEAGDGDKALELAHTIRPDLVIMDIKMPKMNGLKAARIISRSLGIPVLLLTAYSQKDFIEEAKQSFVTGYLVKPIRKSQLIPAVEVSLGQARRIHDLQGEISGLEAKLETRKRVERAKGKLMEQNGWSEEEAYHALRCESMEKRVPIEELSRRILGGDVKGSA
ncbi:ANTAR domain-containing response regulator [Salinithrix halophila]|uniref:ANTAR domain-containing response regulator n=1 Tax=Salinithrix halophila TaxID=1485204 RepID=A0ABV8JLN7_9BACL